MTQIAAKKGLFIVVEGGDGAGKTTLINNIVDCVRGISPVVFANNIVTTYEPGATKLGNKLRQLLLEPLTYDIGCFEELWLILADRKQHVDKVIKPALAADKIVICDRFTDSTLACQWMQCYNKGLKFATFANMTEIAAGGLIPDITFFLDVEPEVSLQRSLAAKQGQADRFDLKGLDFHRRVYDNFKKLVERKRQHQVYFTLDGTQPAQGVCDQAIAHLLDAFNKYLSPLKDVGTVL